MRATTRPTRSASPTRPQRAAADVIRHDRNLGYGGNQKSGYRWAIDHGLDIVVLLHGDGQYAPEVIEDIVAPLIDGHADAVFGSRMLTRGAARAGGMPLYKFAGNRILTVRRERPRRARPVGVAQRLSRLPRRRPRRHPVRVVLRRLRLRHGDHPRPARGREVDRRGADPHLLRRRDLLRQRDALRQGRHRRRRPLPAAAHGLRSGARPPATTPTSSSSRRTPRTPCCCSGSPSVRRAGCSTSGAPTASSAPSLATRRSPRHRRRRGQARRRRRAPRRVRRGRPQQGLPPRDWRAGYDCIVAADVLEHTIAPEHLLADIAERLAPGGAILVSVPNFAHWYPRVRVAAGRFDYDQRGLLDRGHVRFFTRRSFERLVDDCRLASDHGATVVGTPIEDVLDRGGKSPATRRRSTGRRPSTARGEDLADDVRLPVPVRVAPALTMAAGDALYHLGFGTADLDEGTTIALLSGDPSRSERIATEHLGADARAVTTPRARRLCRHAARRGAGRVRDERDGRPVDEHRRQRARPGRHPHGHPHRDERVDPGARAASVRSSSAPAP